MFKRIQHKSFNLHPTNIERPASLDSLLSYDRNQASMSREFSALDYLKRFSELTQAYRGMLLACASQGEILLDRSAFHFCEDSVAGVMPVFKPCVEGIRVKLIEVADAQEAALSGWLLSPLDIANAELL